MAKEKYIIRGSNQGSILRNTLAGNPSYEEVGASISRREGREFLINRYSSDGAIINVEEAIGEELVELTIEHRHNELICEIKWNLEMLLDRTTKFERVVE